MSDIDWQGRYEDARDDLKAMQARAEKAEHALEITGDARALARFRETERERDALKVANAALSDGVLAYEAKVAALEARLAERDAEVAALARNHAAALDELAEVAPVVEAAERLVDADDAAFTSPTSAGSEQAVWVKAFAAVDKTVRALRAARAKRGAGEGGGA